MPCQTSFSGPGNRAGNSLETPGSLSTSAQLPQTVVEAQSAIDPDTGEMEVMTLYGLALGEQDSSFIPPRNPRSDDGLYGEMPPGWAAHF